MDQTAQVRVKARRAECQAAGSLHLPSSQVPMRGGNMPSTLSSSSDLRLPCARAWPLSTIDEAYFGSSHDACESAC